MDQAPRRKDRPRRFAARFDGFLSRPFHNKAYLLRADLFKPTENRDLVQTLSAQLRMMDPFD